MKADQEKGVFGSPASVTGVLDQISTGITKMRVVETKSPTGANTDSNYPDPFSLHHNVEKTNQYFKEHGIILGSAWPPSPQKPSYIGYTQKSTYSFPKYSGGWRDRCGSVFCAVSISSIKNKQHLERITMTIKPFYVDARKNNQNFSLYCQDTDVGCTSSVDELADDLSLICDGLLSAAKDYCYVTLWSLAQKLSTAHDTRKTQPSVLIAEYLGLKTLISRLPHQIKNLPKTYLLRRLQEELQNGKAPCSSGFPDEVSMKASDVVSSLRKQCEQQQQSSIVPGLSPIGFHTFNELVSDKDQRELYNAALVYNLDKAVSNNKKTKSVSMIKALTHDSATFLKQYYKVKGVKKSVYYGLLECLDQSEAVPSESEHIYREFHDSIMQRFINVWFHAFKKSKISAAAIWCNILEVLSKRHRAKLDTMCQANKKHAYKVSEELCQLYPLFPITMIQDFFSSLHPRFFIKFVQMFGYKVGTGNDAINLASFSDGSSNKVDAIFEACASLCVSHKEQFYRKFIIFLAHSFAGRSDAELSECYERIREPLRFSKATDSLIKSLSLLYRFTDNLMNFVMSDFTRVEKSRSFHIFYQSDQVNSSKRGGVVEMPHSINFSLEWLSRYHERCVFTFYTLLTESEKRTISKSTEVETIRIRSPLAGSNSEAKVGSCPPDRPVGSAAPSPD